MIIKKIVVVMGTTLIHGVNIYNKYIYYLFIINNK